jgi:hypothetical protein
MRIIPRGITALRDGKNVFQNLLQKSIESAKVIKKLWVCIFIWFLSVSFTLLWLILVAKYVLKVVK